MIVSRNKLNRTEDTGFISRHSVEINFIHWSELKLHERIFS